MAIDRKFLGQNKLCNCHHLFCPRTREIKAMHAFCAPAQLARGGGAKNGIIVTNFELAVSGGILSRCASVRLLDNDNHWQQTILIVTAV